MAKVICLVPDRFGFMPPQSQLFVGTILEIVEAVKKVDRTFESPQKFEKGQWYKPAGSGPNKKAMTKCQAPKAALALLFQNLSRPVPAQERLRHHATMQESAGTEPAYA